MNGVFSMCDFILYLLRREKINLRDGGDDRSLGSPSTPPANPVILPLILVAPVTETNRGSRRRKRHKPIAPP